MQVFYPPPESPDDTRQDYHYELVQAALDKTADSYGPALLEPGKNIINEWRQYKYLLHGDEGIDFMIKPTSIQSEKELTPVRIPLDKGLLGYRIFLIRKDKQEIFSRIKTIEGLKKKICGQGYDWGDVAIYKHNAITVKTGSVYEGLFEMLIKGRFDYFPRGILEVFPEQETRKEKFPQLHIEETIILHYPFVRYAWFSKNEKGALLTKRVTQGMEKMIKDGTFDAIFYAYHKDIIDKADIKNRVLIKIKNPFIPDTVPFHRKELWFIME
jgi:hypothetical protein